MRIALLLLVTLSTTVAQAQTADVTRFRAPITQRGGIGIDAAQPLAPLQLAAGVWLDYGKNPVTFRYPLDTYQPVVSHQLILDATLAMGIINGVDVGVVVPVMLSQTGPDGTGFADLTGSSVGDIRLVPRVQLVDESSWGVSVAFIPELTLPTGNANRFSGDDGVSFRPRVVASVPVSFLRFNGSVAYRFRKDVDVLPSDATTAAQGVRIANEIEFQAGVDARVIEGELPLNVLAEFSGYTAAAHPFTGDGLFGLELLGGVRTRVAKMFDITVAGAAGLTQGVGTPMWRGVLGLTVQPEERDRDHDGIVDRLDACPTEPEDFDLHDDLDGCPDPDNDLDGIPDTLDKCVNTPETPNGIADSDGCPDGDPMDIDGDGIPQGQDKCPQDPEDIDGFQDEDGCPDRDNDRDGVVDENDECPTERETINGIDDFDGCPDEGTGVTEYVQNRKIVISQTVNFETAKSVIKDESKSLLDQVALQIIAHDDEIQLIRIEGHTDDVGAAEGNRTLSQARAEAVRTYLIARGVRGDKLVAKGYGEDQPIDTNATPEGRARNRRVEFIINELNAQ